MSPERLLAVVVAILAVAWLWFLAVDIWQLRGTHEGSRHTYHWLFNDQPVEWMQWVLLLAAAPAAAYVAGRLADGVHAPAARFFGWLSAGLAVMILEDAGDVRHELRGHAQRLIGSEEALGLNIRTLVDTPYFALVAIIPIYALVRYGHHVWRYRRPRAFMIPAFGLYALAGLGSGFRGEIYTPIGRWVNASLLGGRFPGTSPAGSDPDRAHFLLVDSVIEESVELLAAACMVAMILAFVREVRRGTAAGDDGSAERV